MALAPTSVGIRLSSYQKDCYLQALTRTEVWSEFDHPRQDPNERLHLFDGLDARITTLGDVSSRTLDQFTPSYKPAVHPSCTVYTNTRIVVHTHSVQLILPARASPTYEEWRILQAPLTSPFLSMYGMFLC